MVDNVANRLLAAVEQREQVHGVMLVQLLAELIGYPLSGDTGESPAGDGKLPDATTPGPADANLALYEGRIAALQQAMVKLAGFGDAQAQVAQRQDGDALQERLGNLESRMIEQERTIRHTLTMLIDWIERDETHSFAA